jgi:hypothetical protein
MTVDFLWRKLWMKGPTGRAQLFPRHDGATVDVDVARFPGDCAFVTVTHRLNINN